MVWNRVCWNVQVCTVLHLTCSNSDLYMPAAASSRAGLDPWERPGDVWEDLNTPEFEDPDAPVDYSSMGQTECGQCLADYILYLKATNTLTATQACILAFWAKGAGAVGCVEQFALQPERHSHRYSRHLDNILGVKKSKFYPLRLAQNARMSASRILETIYTNTVQDVFQKIVDSFSDLRKALKDAIAANKVPPCYHANPIVTGRADAEVVLPLIIYVDGIAITRRDGCIAYTMYSPIPPLTRHLLVVLRKEDLCKCGCRGWCTVYTVHAFIKWGLDALADGHHSATRHDNTSFLPSDARRAELAGQPFAASFVVKGVVVLVKGDLKELSTTWGLPDTSSHSAMCPCCHHVGTDFLEHNGFSPTAMPSATKTHADMLAACSACEVRTPVLNWNEFVQIRAALGSFLEIDGPRGRALLVSLPVFGLHLKDRLEPTHDLPDVYAIDDWTSASYTPRTLLFWRRSAETLTRHRSPLWDHRIGLTLESCLAKDFLHIFSKGIYQMFCAEFFHVFFEVDALETTHTAWESKVAATVMTVRAMLFTWYGEERRAGRVRTQLQNLVPSMFGSKGRPTFDLHASETNHILPFVRLLMEQYAARIPNHEAWTRGLDPLLQTLELYHRNSYSNWPAADIENFCYHMRRHLQALKDLGIHGRPKHHFAMEAGRRLSITGSLALSATWDDEGLNKVIKGIGTFAHRRVWTFRVLDEFERASVLHPRVKTFRKKARID